MAETEILESQKIAAVELMHVEEKADVVEATEDNEIQEDEDEDEWDAKSWDDAVVDLSLKVPSLTRSLNQNLRMA